MGAVQRRASTEPGIAAGEGRAAGVAFDRRDAGWWPMAKPTPPRQAFLAIGTMHADFMLRMRDTMGVMESRFGRWFSQHSSLILRFLLYAQLLTVLYACALGLSEFHLNKLGDKSYVALCRILWPVRLALRDLWDLLPLAFPLAIVCALLLPISRKRVWFYIPVSIVLGVLQFVGDGLTIRE
jgi:hypothetical protein